LDVARHPRRWHYQRVRRRVAGHVATGSGIEIGALHHPFPVPTGTRVQYVDRLGTSDLRNEYPELADQSLVEVGVLDDGETLATFDDESVDFVIASHFLEHCEDPIGAIKAHVRVVSRGGFVLLAVPDRRHGIDRARFGTTLEHLVIDHEAGPRLSRTDHYEEWAKLVDLPLGNIESHQIDQHAAALEKRHYSIHFHCWTADEFAAQLREIIGRWKLPAKMIEHRQNHHEFLVVLRRTTES
jgi:SAM-dependent methyltransferase